MGASRLESLRKTKASEFREAQKCRGNEPRRHLSNGALTQAVRDRDEIAERYRLAIETANSADYRGWMISVLVTGDRVEIGVLHPVGRELVSTGAWPVPKGADRAAVEAIILDAVAAIDGEDARARVGWK
jgi:hypothetical protein